MSSERGSSRSGIPQRSFTARPTDDELLDAARAVFAERGLRSATMEAIAERANSTKPTLYAHFGDKQALYRASIAREAAALREWLIAAYDSSGSTHLEHDVRTYVMALFGYAMDQPDSFRLLFDSLDGESSPEQRNLYDLMIERVAQRIRSYRADRGRETGPSAQLLAEMLVGLVGRAVGHTLRDDQLDREPVGELIVSFVASALRHVDSETIEAVDGKRVPQDRTPA
ncbi:MAG TPA: TetR/AcrR family transcriptional regulator [Pseudonocardiaceae bacterium]|jgi:AcrR family transcriptional regulator